MGLSQTQLNRLAQIGVQMLGSLTESVTYYAKTTPGASPTIHTSLLVHFEQYLLHELGTVVGQSEILQSDRKVRIQTALVTWIPTLYDEMVRRDGTRWRVLSGGEGANRPWTFLPTRQIA